jgi:tetratricopeptide (TPR) repeat protein
MSALRPIVLSLALALCGNAAAAQAVCDPDSAVNDSARLMHVRGDLAGTRTILQPVLRHNRYDFRANYLIGLVMVDESGLETKGAHDPAKVEAALDQLAMTANLLDKIDAGCAESKNWYSIYNTLGAEYSDAGNSAEALHYLLKGYEKRGRMAASTRQKLLTNLGSLYFAMGDYASAARYFGEAKDAGAAGAARSQATATELAAIFRRPAGR